MTYTKIIVRTFNDKTDPGFIYSTMPKAVYYAPNWPIHEEKSEFFKDFYEYLNDMIPKAKIYIACLYDNPETILGYAMVDRTQIEFIYVKEMFRKQGLAKLLIKNKGIKSFNELHLTKVGAEIIARHPDLFKNEEPLKKEEYNEQDPI